MSKVELGGVVALSVGGVVLVGVLIGSAVLLTLKLKAKDSSAPKGAPAQPWSGSGVQAPILNLPSSAAGLAASTLPVTAAPAMPSAAVIPLGNGLVQTPSGVVSSTPPAFTETQANDWRKTDKIRELKTELANVQNDMKNYMVDLDKIDRQTDAPYDLVQQVKDQHVQDCINHTDGWALNFGGYQVCAGKHDLSEGYDKVLEDKWKLRKAGDRLPTLTRLSERDDRQGQLIKNLSDLGVSTPVYDITPNRKTEIQSVGIKTSFSSDSGSSSSGSSSSPEFDSAANQTRIRAYLAAQNK